MPLKWNFFLRLYSRELVHHSLSGLMPTSNVRLGWVEGGMEFNTRAFRLPGRKRMTVAQH
jgi:hypothetical protein